VKLIFELLVFTSTLLLLRKRVLSFEPAVAILIFESVAIVSSILIEHDSFVIRGGGLPPIYTSPEMFEVTSSFFSLASFAIFCGALVFGIAMKNWERIELSDVVVRDNVLIEKFSKIYLTVMYLILAKYLVNVGSILIQRDTYLYNLGGSLNGNIHYYLPIFGIVSFLISLKIRTKYLKILLMLHFMICLFESFASASRGITVQLAALTFILFFHTPKWYQKFVTLFMGIGITVWFTSIVLILRSLPQHGLLPYIKAIFSSQQNLTIDFSEFLGNFLSIIPTTYLGSKISPPNNMLLVQVSPLTGRSNGWYEMAGSLMVNPATPSGAVAQIGSLGTIAAFLTWFSLGVILSFLGRLNASSANFKEQQFASYVLILGAVIQMLQYSLRIGMRFLYLDLIMILALKGHKIVSKSKNV